MNFYDIMLWFYLHDSTNTHGKPLFRIINTLPKNIQQTIRSLTAEDINKFRLDLFL